MRWQVIYAITATLLSNTATSSYVHEQGLPVEKTVTLPGGQIIDWIKREIQGEIAHPPPSIGGGDSFGKINLSPFDEVSRGPEGTVPIPRSDGKLPQTKASPPHGNGNRHNARQYATKHWYVSSSQSLNSHGSTGTISLFKAFVANEDDFSLLQTAVAYENVPRIGIQTVEAGWINFPSQVAQPHLFTFFNTNNYGGFGDYISGWNTDYRGWVQYDNTYYPGMPLSPLSVVDGTQQNLQIQYKLFSGNWWLGVNGKWIGYYPASMFVTSGNNAAVTLCDHATTIDWYGEVYQSENQLTTTDMGSGHWANERLGKAAYIRNMRITSTNDSESDYDGSRGVTVSDPNRYTIETHFNSGTDFGSYFFLGGPGAGGVIDG
ncbi:hypothetical protein NQ176_g8370 [Zarea fungicola]|uniref:Uncharacterized protein n=1 Tax=Zarea fungicola TaxID=93591 RepID=A0ACC1MUV5_9HYPO|nr:hypothetical protein NQ176_g8370 [Lecanicillium fungicola]